MTPDEIETEAPLFVMVWELDSIDALELGLLLKAIRRDPFGRSQGCASILL